MAQRTDLESQRSKPPARSPAPGSKSQPAEIAAFLAQASATAQVAGAGRLIFALDATMSRQPTWDLACQLQAEMFRAAGRVGGLSVQLVYYRGNGEAKASAWAADATALARSMAAISCHGGLTQIAAGEPARLMGYPVLIAEDMPDIAAGAFAIAFGD
ncbi:phage major capsid protein, partial [Amaricoccus sp. HAR-UPW-R2A-40]